jgi:hypothetical protein
VVEGFKGTQERGSDLLAEMAKKHSSEEFYALDDPLEAAVFSVLLELVKKMDKAHREKKIDLTSSPQS